MKLDTLVGLTLAICALTVTSLVVHREVSGSMQRPEQKPHFITGWRADLGNGVRFGKPEAPVQLIEFADFECPFCGKFHTVLKSVRDRYPNQVALTYVHFPLPMLRFAIPAARVAACAGEQGQFEAMSDHLLEEQDSFGFKPWSEFATESGVSDLAAFDACIKMTSPVPGVEEGRALGTKLDVKGTPTVIVNGWMLGRPPTAAELDAMVKAVLAGKEPVQGGRRS
jgi:protein-disulfide isomerase